MTHSLIDWLFNTRLHIIHTVTREPTVIDSSPAELFLLFASWSGSCLWAAWDASRRGKSVVGVVFFVLFAWWPVSLLWWRWLRPPLLPPDPAHKLKPWEYLILGVLLLTFIGVIAFLLHQ